MAVDPELLEILCCPETKQALILIEGDKIERVNQSIEKGELRNRGGELVKEPVEAGLLREDRKYLYPIRDSIPIMLQDEAISFEAFDRE